MSEWWTYRLTSFLLFSPRTYFRQFELYNTAIWPAQLAGAAIGLAIVALLVTNHRGRERIVVGLLAACWLWVAWAFHYERYAQINWVAPWFAAAFALQALLLVIVGVLAGRISLRFPGGRAFWFAIALMTFAVLGYPLLTPLAGRPWTTAEIFGAAPDPTAIATVAALSLVRGRIRWLLLPLPLLWCTATALTLWAMASPQALVVAIATLLASVPAMHPGRG
jgi:Family of unknown function (DUF6064)